MAKIVLSFLEDYNNPKFMSIFRDYFKELEIDLKEDTDVFDLMNKEKEEKGMETLLLFEDDFLCSFIMFQENVLKGWFFTKKDGFIREFYVAPDFRSKGYGSLLLNEVEKHLLKKEVHSVILTTDTAELFYEKRGYVKNPSYNSVNKMDVYCKII